MNVKRLYAGLTGLILAGGLAGGLAACGSAAAPAAVPKAAVTVTATPTPTVTPTPTPTVTKTKTVVVPPAPVYAPAAPALTDAGNGIFAGANTSVPFAQNVVSTWLASGAPSVFDAYSPVTGQWYTMYASGGHPVVFRGGNNALVEYYDHG